MKTNNKTRLKELLSKAVEWLVNNEYKPYKVAKLIGSCKEELLSFGLSFGVPESGSDTFDPKKKTNKEERLKELLGKAVTLMRRNLCKLNKVIEVLGSDKEELLSFGIPKGEPSIYDSVWETEEYRKEVEYWVKILMSEYGHDYEEDEQGREELRDAFEELRSGDYIEDIPDDLLGLYKDFFGLNDDEA